MRSDDFVDGREDKFERERGGEIGCGGAAGGEAGARMDPAAGGVELSEPGRRVGVDGRSLRSEASP